MTTKPRQALPPERVPLSARIGHSFYLLYAGVMTVIGWVAEPLQRWITSKRMAYFFVLPNLLIFGLFVLFPMLLNIYYAFTGGTALFPQERPFVGGQNFQRGPHPVFGFSAFQRVIRRRRSARLEGFVICIQIRPRRAAGGVDPPVAGNPENPG